MKIVDYSAQERVDTEENKSPYKKEVQYSVERVDTTINNKSAEKSDDYATTDWGTSQAGGIDRSKRSLQRISCIKQKKYFSNRAFIQ